MFVVIFEVQPKKERWDDYLALAKQLKPKLEAIDGFIEIDRLADRQVEGRVLSLSTFRDEKSVVRWRSQGEHHGVQAKGRAEIFADYHLRVGEVVSDTHPPAGHRVTEQRLDETETGAAKAVSITELTQAGGAPFGAETLGLDVGAAGLVDHSVFESIYTPGNLLLLASWRDAGAARRWDPAAARDATTLRHRRVRIVRDYGMFDRREAPQFHRPVVR
jgi:heme-degrading monooxygenase HmoA